VAPTAGRDGCGALAPESAPTDGFTLVLAFVTPAVLVMGIFFFMGFLAVRTLIHDTFLG